MLTRHTWQSVTPISDMRAHESSLRWLGRVIAYLEGAVLERQGRMALKVPRLLNLAWLLKIESRPQEKSLKVGGVRSAIVLMPDVVIRMVGCFDMSSIALLTVSDVSFGTLD